MSLRAQMRHPALWIGLIVGAVGMWAASQLPYVNWTRFMPPIDERPLQIRQDAKGDGRYLSPRSGHRRHRGVDLSAPMGSPVRAMRSGTVVQVGRHRGLGWFIELEHPGRLTSLYAHLDTTSVEVGKRVKQGEAIGTIGKTGNARSRMIQPHLHFEVWKGGRPIDPAMLGLEAVALSSTTDDNPDGRGGD